MTAPGDHHRRPAGEAGPAKASEPVSGEDARLADIVRSSHDAIVGWTLDGVVTAWNRAAEKLYGYRADEIVGRSAGELCPPECRAGEAAVLRQIARGERLDPYVTERVRRDGSTVLVWLSVSPIVDDTDKIVGLASVSRGVADHHRTEALRGDVEGGGEARPSRSQGILPARTSHDLRTPLQAIIGFTGTLLLHLPGPLNDEQERQLGLVDESARQLLSLINQLSRPVDR
jgi:PAS domain S-box-containing protein